MTQFIVRLDDVGQACEPQSEPDVGLRYFQRWLDAWGEPDEPIYLGVVPAMVGPVERDILEFFESASKAIVSLHGWDHAAKALELSDLAKAVEVFPAARSAIPPYNRYDVGTIAAMDALHLSILFGGFDGEHHYFGPAPRTVGANGRILHLSAEPELYAKSYQVAPRIEAFPDPGYPVVVTLHPRWDRDSLRGVTQLHDALRGKIVSADNAWPQVPA